MKILVTGGAGYIGSHVVYELIRAGYEPVVLDNLTTGNEESIHEKAFFYKGDQRDFELLNKIFNEHKITGVIHLAAKLIVHESIKEPIEYFENNVHGLAALLKAMNKHKVNKLIFSSTAAVYGEANGTVIDEQSPTKPINPYGQSKLACEWMIESESNAHGLKYIIYRYFNVAGADVSGKIGQSTKGAEVTHLIPSLIEASLGRRKELIIYGKDYLTPDGTCIRDYLHVSDLAKSHVKALEQIDKGVQGIFNLGSEKGFSVKQVVDVAQKSGLKVPHSYGKAKLGDPARLVASIKKAQTAQLYSPDQKLEDMIKSDWQWQKNKLF